MKYHHTTKIAGLVACLLWTGCGGATGSHSTTAHTAGGEASAAYDGPIASADTQRGAEQFDVLCGTCHPDGEDDIGPSLLGKRFPPAYVRKMVREGSGRMRPIPVVRMADEDLEAVLAYLVGIDAVAAGEPAAID